MRDIEFALAKVKGAKKKLAWFKPNNFYDWGMYMERTSEMFTDILNIMEEHIEIFRACSCPVCGQAMQGDHALKRHLTMKHKGKHYERGKVFNEDTRKVC